MKDVIRKVKVEANKDLKLEVYMQMDMKSLDQVVVAAKGERKEIHDVKRQGTPVAVIDGKQLAGRGTTITEVLNHQTGVKLRQTGGVGNQTKVNIRGLEGKPGSIYMDGYALNTRMVVFPLMIFLCNSSTVSRYTRGLFRLNSGEMG